MVKRIFAFGSAIVLAFSLSVSSFAASNTSTVNMDFPYFGYVTLRNTPQTFLYQGSKGSRPISGVQADIESSDSSVSAYLIDFIFGGTYNLGVVSDESQTITFRIPTVSYVENQGTDYSGTYDPTRYNAHYTSNNERIDYMQPYSSSEDFEFSSDDWRSIYHYQESFASATISGGESLVLKNASITGGYYTILGYFDYPSNTFSSDVDLSSIFTGAVVRAYTDTVDAMELDVREFNLYPVAYDSSTTYKRVSFNVVFHVPYNMSCSRVQVGITTRNLTSRMMRFGVSTCGYEYQDTVTGVAGLSAQLGNWFSGLKSSITSGFSNIVSRLEKEDSDADKAASAAASSAVSEASSDIAEIHAFEGTLNSNISSSVQNIDFSLPAGSGFVNALGAVSYIFTSVFNSLGVYQFIITIPLILGIFLLLVGRSSRVLGAISSSREREK